MAALTPYGWLMLVAGAVTVLFIIAAVVASIVSWWRGDPPGTFAGRVRQANPGAVAQFQAKRERPGEIRESREP